MSVYDEIKGYDVSYYDSVLIIGFIIICIMAVFLIYSYPVSDSIKRLIPNISYDGYENKTKKKNKKQPSKEGFISSSFSKF